MIQLCCKPAAVNAAMLFAVALLALSSGCATISPLTSAALPAGQQEMAAERGTYTVEMHSVAGQPKRYEGVLTGSTTVSEALEAAGAVKRRSVPDVEVLRIVQHKGVNRGLRMPVEFNGKAGPSPEQDYALLDGDRVVVKPQRSSGLMKMLGTIAGQ